MKQPALPLSSRDAQRQADVVPLVSVVLPTFNERENLPCVVASIHRALHQVAHEIIVVDDNSPDGTWRWVAEQAERNPALRLVRRTSNPGLSASVIEGFRVACSDRFIVMDADGQHDASLLPAMQEALASQELIVPTRYGKGGSTARWNPLRWFGSKGATWLAQLILNVPLSDPMSGFFGIRRDAWEGISAAMNPKGFKILLELYYRLSLRHASGYVDAMELPYRFGRRIAGKSKLGSRVVWQYLLMLFELRKESPWPQGLPRFLTVGLMGLLVNCGILWMLVRCMYWPLLVGGASAIQLSILHNFVWHEHWTFKHRRDASAWWLRLGRYEVAMAIGMTANWTILAALGGWAHWPILLANIVGAAFGAMFNFALSKLWAWKRRSEARQGISRAEIPMGKVLNS